MKKQEFYATATEIRILMRILSKMMQQEFQEHLAACGVGISPPHFGVMRLLKHHPYTIKELSKHMLVEPASLVPIVDELERQAYVRRTIDPQDRRRTPLILTETGDHLVTTLPAMPTTTPLLNALRKMGKAKMNDLLTRLRELAHEMNNDPELMQHISTSVRMQVSARAATLDKKRVK